MIRKFRVLWLGIKKEYGWWVGDFGDIYVIFRMEKFEDIFK